MKTPKNSEKATCIVLRNLGHAKPGSPCTTGAGGAEPWVAAGSSCVPSIAMVTTMCSVLAVEPEGGSESCENEGSAEGLFGDMSVESQSFSPQTGREGLSFGVI